MDYPCNPAIPGHLIVLFMRQNEFAVNFFAQPDVSGPEGYVRILAQMTQSLSEKDIDISNTAYESYLIEVDHGEELLKINWIQMEYYKFLFSDENNFAQFNRQYMLNNWRFFALTIDRNSPYTLNSPPHFSYGFSPTHTTNMGIINPSGKASSSPAPVALIDSGIDALLGANIVGNQSFVTDSLGVLLTPDDENGHGTQMAQIISELSPKVEIYNYRVADISGDLFEWALLSALFTTLVDDSQIINLSLSQGISQDNDCGDCGLAIKQARSLVLELVVQEVYSKGKLLIGAAGNAGLAELNYPAKIEMVLAICSINTGSQISDFSNFGTDAYKTLTGVIPHKHVYVAPGGNRSPSESIFSSTGYYGTSHAAAYASGAISVLWGNNPSWSLADLLDHLDTTYNVSMVSRGSTWRRIKI
ncbi:S8 family peptidase [Dyadobacter sp. BHUBP1]|uniref:S8 family peptidase n=1 Tax=Dyadobacter sp. BHUBP1 TaxID=3424178 RepID=UPI003D3579E5